MRVRAHGFSRKAPALPAYFFLRTNCGLVGLNQTQRAEEEGVVMEGDAAMTGVTIERLRPSPPGYLNGVLLEWRSKGALRAVPEQPVVILRTKRDLIQLPEQRPKRILVSDDSSPGREFIRVVLEHAGHMVVEASDGIEAVREALEVPPDLIVMELVMPGMNGIEVLRRLSAGASTGRHSDCGLTACAMPADRWRIRSTGFNANICKPIGLTALRTELSRFLE